MKMCAPSDVAGWGDALLPSSSSSLAGVNGFPPLITLSYTTDQQHSTVSTGAPCLAAEPCTTCCFVQAGLVCMRLPCPCTGVLNPRQPCIMPTGMRLEEDAGSTA